MSKGLGVFAFLNEPMADRNLPCCRRAARGATMLFFASLTTCGMSSLCKNALSRMAVSESLKGIGLSCLRQALRFGFALVIGLFFGGAGHRRHRSGSTSRVTRESFLAHFLSTIRFAFFGGAHALIIRRP